MPRNRKFFIHNSAVFATSRITEGLPLAPTHCLNEIIWGILARGQRLYPVRICHFVFMANHFHMLFVVHDPEDIGRFTGYVKAEITHAVNRFLHRRKKSIWDKGYDSPVILTKQDVEKYIAYIYTNPTKPGLVDSIDEYPGVSSWELFRESKPSRKCKYIRRDEIPRLQNASIGVNEQKRLTAFLLSSKTAGSDEQFSLEPWAWCECFSQNIESEQLEFMRSKLIETIRNKENLYKSQRAEKNKFAAGPTTLRRQSMLKEHTPEKHSRRMICLSSDKDLRWRFIKHFRELCREATSTFASWKRGETQLRMPPGIFAPCLPLLASTTLQI